MNPEWFKKLRPSQIDAIWRIIQTGKILLAHAVGSGKTYTMIAASMEMRRLGLIRKPMFALLNSTLPGFVAQFRRLYPAANLLIADEKNFSSDKREKFLSRLATNDYDAVLITHSAFNLINVSNETYEGSDNQRDI
jgi:N12 class adenine-specific DNA methylase